MTNREFENFIFERFAKTIRSWRHGSDIYALSLFVHDEEDDSSRPTVTLGFNTESQIKTIPLRPEPVQWRASGLAEARWNYAFWLQNRECVIGETKSDSESARDDWVKQLLSYRDVTNEFVSLCVRVARRLHKERVVSSSIGRPVPVIVHELEYYDTIAQQTSAANPGGIADEFVEWIYSFYDDTSGIES